MEAEEALLQVQRYIITLFFLLFSACLGADNVQNLKDRLMVFNEYFLVKRSRMTLPICPGWQDVAS